MIGLGIVSHLMKEHGRDARATFVLLAVGALMPLLGRAQPMPSLSGVLPVYLRQGESREITLTGQNLTTATSITIPDAAGVTAKLLAAEKPNTPRHVKLSASTDARLGDREL